MRHKEKALQFLRGLIRKFEVSEHSIGVTFTREAARDIVLDLRSVIKRIEEVKGED